MEKIKWSQISFYIAVSFGFSWCVALYLWSKNGLETPLAGVFLFLFMFGPMIGGLAAAQRFNPKERLHVLGLKDSFSRGLNRWLIIAWLWAIGLVALATLLSGILGGGGFQPPVEGLKTTLIEQGYEKDLSALDDIPAINLILILQAVILGAAINMILLLSEELGWRGWLWTALHPLGFWRSAGLTGLLWGIWHAPIIIMGYNYPAMPVWGPIMFTGFCILYSPLYSYLREKNGTVWAACLLHGAGNAVAGVGLMIQANSDMPWRGIVGLGGVAALLLSCLWVWLQRSKRSD